VTFGELLDKVMRVTGLSPVDAAKVAENIYGAERAYTDAGIQYAAASLGLTSEATDAPEATPATPEPQMTMDPAEVLREVYAVMPRVLTHAMPKVGRAPKDSVFYDEDLRAQIDALPEEIRVLIGAVDVVDGSVTFTLYDEANDLDRRIGPIDLTRFSTGEQINEAIGVLLKRLPRVLASDFN
jgi:hypothetical protein